MLAGCRGEANFLGAAVTVDFRRTAQPAACGQCTAFACGVGEGSVCSRLRRNGGLEACERTAAAAVYSRTAACKAAPCTRMYRWSRVPAASASAPLASRPPLQASGGGLASRAGILREIAVVKCAGAAQPRMPATQPALPTEPEPQGGGVAHTLQATSSVGGRPQGASSTSAAAAGAAAPGSCRGRTSRRCNRRGRGARGSRQMTHQNTSTSCSGAGFSR